MVTGYFDNTARNKFNPDPTKKVRHGEPTYDEMMMGFMDYVVEKPAALAKVDPKVLDSYVGHYDMGNKRIYVVTREGDRLYGQATANPRRDLYAVSQTVFVIPEVESQITFVKDEKGQVVELLYDQNERVTRCKRITDATASK